MDWLKKLRTEKGLTCDAVGKEAGITQQHYSFIEAGDRRPSVDVAKRIAGVLGFEWTRFFEDQATSA
ncbi:helix-turn-helix transcriptional regulator [Vermiculatibacterium agrestimuris]|uniref:helix-turn-helix transcriptional regulator n=1 Tax=Vermiculatibacterium agrestimuris TaxID=2941519 RepID=UPI00203C1CD2|nr:helix-turn-helix transcriptional regulator [Vermiculatibacterium agrestimuris]